MLKHCVYVNFKAEVSEQECRAAVSAFAELLGKVEGMLDFSAGPNLDFENKSAQYGWGFVITFADRAALAAYDAHPLHQRYGEQMVALAQGGADGIIVFDLQTN